MPSNNADAIVSFTDVSVEFPVYDSERSFKKMLLHTGIGGVIHGGYKKPQRISVSALRHVSLALQSGDRVGLVGRNGAGKSTLLRVIAGGYPPSSGRVSVKGTVSALLNIGVGMDYDDTGYENIETCGLLLGMTPGQVKEKVGDIADFTELGDYLSMPVRTYSAGMALRLSFAIATAIEPDIVVIDEVFEAGDVHFAQKARRRIEDMMNKARLLVLASHSAETIRLFCDKALYLHSGQLAAFGPVGEVLDVYDNDA